MHRYLTALNDLLFPPALPETFGELFDQTENRLSEFLATHREKLIQGEQLVERLQNRVRELEQIVDGLHRQAETKVKAGRPDEALKLLKVKHSSGASLVTEKEELAEALAALDEARLVVAHEEERLTKCAATLVELREKHLRHHTPNRQRIEQLYSWTLTPTLPKIDRSVLRKLVITLLVTVVVLFVVCVVLLFRH